MIKSYFLLLINLSLTVGLYAQNSDLEWSADRPIDWNDFKKKPPKHHRAAAISAVRFGMEVHYKNNELVVFIQASFDPKESWVKKDQKTEYMLRHEQVHFDICELHARKFRAAVKSTKFTNENVDDEITKLFKKYSEQANKAQDKYDSETNHSLIIAKQKQWNESVAKELKATGMHSKSRFTVSIKK